MFLTYFAKSRIDSSGILIQFIIVANKNVFNPEFLHMLQCKAKKHIFTLTSYYNNITIQEAHDYLDQNSNLKLHLG